VLKARKSLDENDLASLAEQAGYFPKLGTAKHFFLPRLEIISSQIKGLGSMGLLMSVFRFRTFVLIIYVFLKMSICFEMLD
jgi:hypothetical protein